MKLYLDSDRSHALRGNASADALRRVTGPQERPRLHSHAERGNDQRWPRSQEKAGGSESLRQFWPRASAS